MITDSISVKLHKLLEGTMEKIESSEVFKTVFQGKNPQLSLLVLRNVLFEVSTYAPHLIQSSFLAIGRFPRTQPSLTRSVTELVLDEITHADIAKADYRKMGGDPSKLDNARLSVESLVLTATVQKLAAQEKPFTILGFLFLIETMTAKIAPMLLSRLESLMAKPDTNSFVNVHAKEEEFHAASITNVIEDTCNAFPDAEEDVLYGYACVDKVFPLPIWNAAYVRALAEMSSHAV